MFLTETGLIYRGIRPLQKLGSLALNNPFAALTMPQRVPDCLLVVPPELEWTARELVESTYFPDLVSQTSGTGGTQKLATNVLRGAFGVLVTPELSSAADWFLLDTTRIVKPLIAQVRMEPEFTALEGESEAGFLRDEYLYGTRSRDNAAYGLWQYAFGAQV